MRSRASSRLDFPRPVPADLVGGLSVALVVIPQSLAYAGIAEMPPVTGLFASALPLIAFSLFASSPYLQTGPVALASLLTLAALQGAGFDSADGGYVKAAALLALIVGASRLLLGLLRVGWVAFLIAEPVRMGFTSAAAIIIISSQLPKALGTTRSAPEGSTLGRALWSVTHPGQWSLAALGLAVVTVTVMLGGRRLHRLFPGVAIAVIAGLVFTGVFDTSVLTVADDNPVPEGLPSLSLDLPWSQTGTLLVGGLVIALVGFAEPASIARLFAAEDRTKWDANRELAASGIANSVAAVSGAFPVGGSFSRSSVNRLAGARTRWSGGITGLAVLAFLPVASVLDNLPLAVLGAIVVGAVVGLIRPRPLLALWRRSKPEALLAWTTFAATLILAPNVQWAVLVGIGLSVVYHLARPFVLDILDDHEHRVTVRPVGLLWLGSKAGFRGELESVIGRNPTADIEIDFSATPAVDTEVATALRAMQADMEGRGRRLTVINQPDGVTILDD